MSTYNIITINLDGIDRQFVTCKLACRCHGELTDRIIQIGDDISQVDPDDFP